MGPHACLLATGLSARAEGRFLIPSTENATSVTHFARRLPSAEIGIRCTKYRWGLIDGALAFYCTPWLSVLGGLRWDSLYVFMTNPTIIPGFSTISDESDLTISAVEPYLGFEAAWVGRRCTLTLKGIGSPWVSTRTIFGMTFGDPTGDSCSRPERVRTRFQSERLFRNSLCNYVSPDVVPRQCRSICNCEHVVGSL